MGFDYCTGCVNFRDVGEWVNEICGVRLLRPRQILRGGKIDFIHSPEDIGNPGTIYNLRRSADPETKWPGVEHFDFPISNDFEKYKTDLPEVRAWSQNIVKTIETAVTSSFPT